MLRRLIIDAIRNDPEWKEGDYTTQPKAFRTAAVFFGIATSGGTIATQKAAPTRAAADKLLDEHLAAPTTADANDYHHQWEALGDYDPSPGLAGIKARLLAVNAADDERNPSETGLTDNALKQVKYGRLYLIPASEETRGHGTTAMAKFYAKPLGELLTGGP
jgi:homoserine O-acetyltransferase/O-succinyltransferase